MIAGNIYLLHQLSRCYMHTKPTKVRLKVELITLIIIIIMDQRTALNCVITTQTALTLALQELFCFTKKVQLFSKPQDEH